MPQPVPTTLAYCLALGALVVTLFLQTRWISEPFDASLAGVCSADDYGYSIQAFDTHGWVGLKTRPSWFWRAAEVDSFVPYPNHPWLTYAWFLPGYRWLGKDERSLRAGALPLLLLALVGIWMLARLGGTRATAAIAVLFFACSPVIIQYGTIVDFSLFFPALAPLALWAWLRYRIGRSGPGAFIVLATLAGLTSWYAYGLVPALWVDIFLERRRPFPLKAALLAGLPFLCALLSHGAWILVSSGNLDYLGERIAFYVDVVSGSDDHTKAVAGETFNYGSRMMRNAQRCFGLPLLALAGLGLFATLWRNRPSNATLGARWDITARCTLALTVTTVTCSTVLWSRIAAHEFLMLQMAPAVALLCVAGAEGIAIVLPKKTRSAALIPTVVVLIVAVTSVREGVLLHAEYRSDAGKTLAEEINRRFARDDVILAPTADYLSGLRYYVRSGYLPALNSLPTTMNIAHALRPAGPTIPRVILLVREETLPDLPWLKDLPTLDATFHRFLLDGTPYCSVELDKERFLSP